MPDKWGRDYDQLLAQQTRELAHWRTILQPAAFAALRDFCEMSNGPALPIVVPRGVPYKAGGLHQVPVGQELHHFVMKIGRHRPSKSDAALL